MCATVFYRKRIRGQLYPKAARTGPYAFAQEVKRVNGRVVTKYLGIAKVPEGVTTAEGPKADAIENGREPRTERGEVNDDGDSESKPRSLLEFLTDSMPRETEQATI